MSLLTKRFPTMMGLLLLIGLIGGFFYYFRSTNTEPPLGIKPDKVRITNIADNKFSVSWITKEPTLGLVEYGIVGEKLATREGDDRDANDNKPYQTHHVTIEGLQPSTQYSFRILSGEKLVRFDNKGSPYTTGTGPVIGAMPTSDNLYGSVTLESRQPVSGALVYVTLPEANTASAIVGETGNYAFTLSTIRSNDLRSFVKYDPAATIASITVESASAQSVVAVSLVNSAPTPTIVLGKNAEFLDKIEVVEIAEVQPEVTLAEKPSIFNVEPLSDQPEINAVTAGSVTLLNPQDENETLLTLRPEFRGTGPKGLSLSIALTGQKAISDTTQVESDGTWSWAPVIDLKPGLQTITVSYLGAGSTAQKISRKFIVSNGNTSLDPAFVATPSASNNVTASKTPAPSPRDVIPATDSGVPVTGVIENTLLTAGLGIVIMVIGAALFAF